MASAVARSVTALPEGATGRWAAIVGLLLLHLFLYPLLQRWVVAPDFLVGEVLLAALLLKPRVAAVVGFASGLLHASLTLAAVGGTAFLLGVAAYLAGRLRELFFAEQSLYLTVYFFAGTWILEVALAAVSASGLHWPEMLLRAVGDGLLTALLIGPAAAAGGASA